MATSLYLDEFSTFGDLSSVPKDFMGCEGEQSRDKTQKKKKTFWCLSFKSNENSAILGLDGFR